MKTEKDSVIAIISISVIVFIMFFLTLGLWLGSYDYDYYYNGHWYYDNNGIDYDIAFIMFITFSSLFGALSIAFGIWILAKDWKNKNINSGNCKILWGILSILLLGLIASFIFGLIALNNYKKANWKPQITNEHQNIAYENHSNVNMNKYDNLQKLHSLYLSGVINEQEYEKEKRNILN